MKLAYAMGSLNPGGAETQTVRHVVRLAKRGYNVTVVLPNGGGEMAGNLRPYLTEHGIKQLDLAVLPDKLLAMERAMEILKPDVLHTVGYPITLHACLAAYKHDVPVRVHRFDNVGFTRKQFPQPWAFEFAGMKAATHLVGNSQAVAASITSYYGTEERQANVIHNAVDLPDVTEEKWGASRTYFNLKEDDIAIGLLGNFRADGLKNQEMLARVADIVLKKCPEAVFIMCGYHTAYQDKVQRLIDDLGISDRVRIPGRLDDLDMLAGWDIAVNTSRTEGFCNALQECMSYGMPVVATRVGGNPELVHPDKTGFLVDKDNDLKFAAHLIELIGSPRMRQEMGRAGRTWVEDHCSWDTVLDKWLDLYEEGLHAQV